MNDRKRKRKRAHPIKLSADLTPAKQVRANQLQQYLQNADPSLGALDDDSTIDSDDVGIVLVRDDNNASNTAASSNTSQQGLPYQTYSGDSQSADNEDVQPTPGASIGGVAVWATPEAAANATGAASCTETVGSFFCQSRL